MTHPGHNLHVQRGRLLERIAIQRELLARDLQPVMGALQGVDRAVALVQSGVSYARRHPLIPALAVTGLFLIKARRLWRWAQRGVLVWQTWQAVKLRFPFLERRRS